MRKAAFRHRKKEEKEAKEKWKARKKELKNFFLLKIEEEKKKG